MPPSAATDTREGALAYAEHYVATYNYARTTGDMNGLPPLEAFECRTCRALRDDLAAVYDHGGRLEGGQWAMIAPVAKEAPAIDGWVITSPLRVKPTTVYPESSNRKQVPGETTRITFEISRTTGTWEVLACDKEV